MGVLQKESSSSRSLSLLMTETFISPSNDPIVICYNLRMTSTAIKSYKQHKLDPHIQYDALIIGSGISGLTCAAILAKEGQRVLVLEKHYTAGGFTHVFKRNGYEWDVGVHYIGGVGHPKAPLATLFHYLTDGQLQWADMGEVYDRIFFGEEQFAFHKGPQNFADQLKKQFPNPADHRAIEQYLDLIKQAGEASSLYFAEKALPPLVARVAGGQMRKNYLRFASQTTREVLDELTDNAQLSGVLTAQYGDYGLPPGQSSFAMHAMVVGHYLYGGYFPVGGSSRIAETIADVIGAAGGLVLTNTAVDKILLDGKTAHGVRLQDGTELRAPLIISSIGVHNTYERLLPPELTAKLGLPAQLQKVTPSVAHMALYLGFEETADALGLQKANYWVYPAGGYDHDANVARFLADPASDFPVVYISFPAAKDPTWETRYPGRATVDIITLAPYEWFAPWEETRWKRRGDDYEAFKTSFTDRLLEVLFQYEPQLRGKVAHAELSTPLSTREFVNYRQGEIYGLQHDPERFAQDFLRPHTPFKNLYLTGQDIVTCGVGGALMAGVLTVSAIRKRNYVSKIRQAVLADF